MKRITAAFYKARTGGEPVRNWLLKLDAIDRRIVGKDIATVEFGWPAGMPDCKALRDGLYEVRSTIRTGKVEARTYFTINGPTMVLLHGDTRKTRQAEAIKLARDRMRDYRKSLEETVMTNDRVGRLGGTLEDLLNETGEQEEVYGDALKRVLAWSLERERKAKAISKATMAKRMATSRTQLERVLDPQNVNVSLGTMEKAARALGKRLVVELVDA